MANEVPSTVFLAESTAQLIAVMACLSGLGIRDAVVFFERNISFGAGATAPLLAAARSRFPTVRFIEIEIQPPEAGAPAPHGWRLFVRRRQIAQSMREQWDAACRANFGMDLKAVGARTREVYFTALHDYIIAFLAEARGARIFYPHGFDHPRRQQVRDEAYLLRRRSWRTALTTLTRQKKEFGLGGLALGALGRLWPGIATISLPFTGVNRVLTFRSDVDYVPNEIVKVPGLEETFRWLLQLPPWNDLLRERANAAKNGSLLLLLPECNCNPIWEKNRNFGISHLRLLQTVSQATGAKRFVIKAHIRSDGSAAEWLARFLKEREQSWAVEILSPALAGLPVEALVLTGEFAAACSLASCSLPPGLGFGVPHYVSPATAVLFDEGWGPDGPAWLNYAEAARMLIHERIARDADQGSKAPNSNL